MDSLYSRVNEDKTKDKTHKKSSKKYDSFGETRLRLRFRAGGTARVAMGAAPPPASSSVVPSDTFLGIVAGIPVIELVRVIANYH